MLATSQLSTAILAQALPVRPDVQRACNMEIDGEDAAAPTCAPPTSTELLGPASFGEIASWAWTDVTRLTEQAPALAAQARKNASRGIVLTSHYSGCIHLSDVLDHMSGPWRWAPVRPRGTPWAPAPTSLDIWSFSQSAR